MIKWIIYHHSYQQYDVAPMQKAITKITIAQITTAAKIPKKATIKIATPTK